MLKTNLFILIQGVYITFVISQSTLPQPCPHEIYCYGRLLHTVQMARVYEDSKTFVDMKLKKNSSQTIEAFDKFMDSVKQNPTVKDLKKFVEENFEPPGSEFEKWTPTDWKESPKFLEEINDRALRDWAKKLNDLWKLLGRKIKQEVMTNAHLYSIIPVPNPVIVPGGRFREFYYWDSYWIVRGLLLSEMTDTVKGMLANFISIVDKYGLIPNGGRVYYLQRSQPPLLIPMVESYLEFTNDQAFLKKNIKSLENEFKFWLNNRTVTVNKDNKNYKLFRYQDRSLGPRPESYREDVLIAEYMKEEEKNEFYSELKTAAEAGWDFSSRWYISPNGTNLGNLTNVKIKSIIPVDLNSILYWNAKLLSKYFKLLEQPQKVEYYNKIADDLLEAVTAVLWDPVVGAWLDYDLINNKTRNYFHPTNLAPLWTNCYPQDQADNYLEKILTYLSKTKVLAFLGGIPASMVFTGEQWDYPNAWPPSQYIFIMGLDQTNNSNAQKIAFDLSEKWIRGNFDAFKETGHMYEKYDATIRGGHGSGGEYDVQLGFGWTNGVILELLHKYGSRIILEGITRNVSKVQDSINQGTTVSSEVHRTPLKIPTNQGAVTYGHHLGPAFTLVLAFGATLTAAFIGSIVYTKRHTPSRPDKSKYTKIPGAPNL